MRKLNVRLCAEDDLRAGARRDLLVTADEVGVQVRLDHILDFQSLRVRFLDVFIDITLRIDNRRFAIRANQI